MNGIGNYRGRVLGAVLVVVVLAFGAWYVKRYRPRAELLAVRQATLVQKQEQIALTRRQLVEKGEKGLQEAIARYEQQARDLSSQVPGGADAGRRESEVTQLVTAAARQYGVTIHASTALPAQVQAPFSVGGATFQVSGRYHDVGSFLTAIVSLPRLTQIRSARLDAVPDSLMLSALKESPKAKAAPKRVDKGARVVTGVVWREEKVALPPDEPPFNVVALFTLNWYSVADSAAIASAAQDTVSARPGVKKPLGRPAGPAKPQANKGF